MKKILVSAALAVSLLTPAAASAQAIPAAVIAVVDLERVSRIDALKGKEPDAALKARITAFQSKQQQGAEELQRQQQQLQRNQQYIQKQIVDKLGPIYQQVMQRRGANVMMETGSTLATSTTVDVTNDVLAALNTALPSIQTTAPAAQQQTPQTR
jgi:outer membrane protein